RGASPRSPRAAPRTGPGSSRATSSWSWTGSRSPTRMSSSSRSAPTPPATRCVWACAPVARTAPSRSRWRARAADRGPAPGLLGPNLGRVDINGPELLVLGALALFVLGPDKLPGYAAQASRMLRQLRVMADGARDQVREQLGPEFDDVDWNALDPRQYD